MISRSEFLLDESVVFLNHGSFGACPTVLQNIQQSWLRTLETEPVAYYHALPGRMQDARTHLASFVDASPKDVVYVTNSTYGANIMAFTMARYLKSGDAVLIPNHEYGACARAWQMHLEGTGIEIQTCDIPMPIPNQNALADIILQSVSGNTKAIFISHVTSPTACRMPIEELASRAKKAGILMLVDGAHALGHFPVSLRTLDVDMYTGNCHKWMCAPKGSALFWVKHELQPHVLPVVRSWGVQGLSVGDGEFVDEHEYTGTRDASAFLTTPDTIRWLNDKDWWTVKSKAHELVQYGMQKLLQIDGVVAMAADWKEQNLLMGAVLLPDWINGPDLQRQLLNDYHIQVVCMQWLDKPLLRFSVHGYTTSTEIDVLVNALQTIVSAAKP